MAGSSGPVRMCGCCRKSISNGTESLILNGLYAHVACVEAVLREPGAVAVVTDLQLVTDDQLRAECERRGIGHVSEPMCTVAERDEWKRKYDEMVQRFGGEAEDHAVCLSIAEGAPGWRELKPTRPSHHAVMKLRERYEGSPMEAEDHAKLVKRHELGPGIERLPAAERAGTVDLATLADLLADDAP